MRRVLALLCLIANTTALGEESPIEAARSAFVKGDYHKAIELARPRVAIEPDAAWRVIGASSCFLKDRAGAKEAYGRLDAKGQAFVKYVCSRNEITVP